MNMPKHLLPTTVVGSYPQPEWLVDRAMLSKSVPRTRMHAMWRLPEEHLEEAQDDATIVAIRDMERAGIDIVTDGEIRRESYSNRFATALEGIDIDNPAIIKSRSGQDTPVPRVVGPVRRTQPVELRDMEFLRRNTDRAAKITLPGPFTMSQQAKNEFYKDEEELAMAFAEAVNAEALDLQKAGADVIQLDEPWVRNNPDLARRFAVKAINRALQGITVPTVVHLCFGYAAVVPGSTKPAGYSFLAELADTIVTVLYGPGGIGKSFFLKRTGYRMARAAMSDPRAGIPIFAELPLLLTSDALEIWLSHRAESSDRTDLIDDRIWRDRPNSGRA